MDTRLEAGYQSQCLSCLTVGRKLLPIGVFSATFQVLVPEFCSQIMTPIENAKLCWECHSLLKKAANFRCRVLKAMEILHNGQAATHSTLSTLTTVIKNDIEPHYVDEIVQLKKENDSIKDDFDSVHYDSPSQDDIEEESRKPEIEATAPMDVKTEIKECFANNATKSSKWALKRAKQNRKPKFAVLRAKDLKVDILFRRETTLTSKLTRCLNCGLDYKSGIDLLNHYRNIHEKEFVCDFCNAVYSDKVRFVDHMTCHDIRYECALCNYVCFSEVRCYKHLMKCHRRVFECAKCFKKFVSRREFYQHYKQWHEKFVCDYCGISFKMRYCIKDHIRKQHSPIECRPCNKRFARYNGLWLHRKLHHGPPAVTAYCVECDKSYPDIYRYRWHLANSTKHKPRKKVRIPCPECDKVFSKNIYMKDHYNLVHLKQYKYRCEDCDKNYIRNADLVKHKRRVHEGILPPKNKICYYCGRGFTTNKILSNHLRTHTGERPFACAACPARFAQRTALVGHTRALHNSGEKNTKT